MYLFAHICPLHELTHPYMHTHTFICIVHTHTHTHTWMHTRTNIHKREYAPGLPHICLPTYARSCYLVHITHAPNTQTWIRTQSLTHTLDHYRMIAQTYPHTPYHTHVITHSYFKYCMLYIDIVLCFWGLAGFVTPTSLPYFVIINLVLNFLGSRLGR